MTIDEEIAQVEQQIYDVGLTLRDAWLLPRSESSALIVAGEKRTKDLRARLRVLRTAKAKGQAA